MSSKTKRTFRAFNEYLLEALKDPKEVQGYLDTSFEEYSEDEDLEMLLKFLSVIATAKGGILQLKEEAEVDVAGLHKLLDEVDRPRREEVLDALGYDFSPMSVETSPSY